MKVTHEINREKTTDIWLTPPEIIRALGVFDLDPCAATNRPFDTAKNHYTKDDNGLTKDWYGRVWLNPPYGPPLMPLFLEKMAQHNNGILLIFNRTETKQFTQWIWPYASAILFKEGRIHFLRPDGKKGNNGSGCGSVLVAYGSHNAEALKNSGIAGKFIDLKDWGGL